jgi:hypothetical protein
MAFAEMHQVQRQTNPVLRAAVMDALRVAKLPH